MPEILLDPITLKDVMVYLRNSLNSIVKGVWWNPTTYFLRGVDAVSAVTTVTTVSSVTSIGANPAYTVVLAIDRMSWNNCVRSNIS
jgi:hypothetical protein